jgi:hypothetical protein
MNLKIISFIVFLFLLATPASAADLSVSCPGGGNTCTVTGLSPLFSASVDGQWYPGKTVTKTFTVTNASGQSQDIRLSVNRTSSPNATLESLYSISIPSYYSGTLSDFYSQTSILLGSLNSGASQDYSLTAVLDSSTGNSHQNKQLNWDLTLGFFQTPTSPASSGGSSNNGGGGSNGPSCTASKPVGVPNLTATVSGPNTVLLSWSPVSPATHYMIRYGTTPGIYLYGAPNVGNTTSFTVAGLSGGVTYYFQVAGVNDCTGGDWSTPDGATPGGAALPEGPATGFGEALGLDTEVSPSPSTSLTTTPTPAVSGASTCSSNLWWVPLVLFALSMALLYWRSPKLFYPPIGMIITFILSIIIGCTCSGLCHWSWAFNLGITIISLLGFYQKGRRLSS